MRKIGHEHVGNDKSVVEKTPNVMSRVAFVCFSIWVPPRWKNPGARSRQNSRYKNSSTPWPPAPNGRCPRWRSWYRTGEWGLWIRCRAVWCASTRSGTLIARARTPTIWNILRTSPKTITPAQTTVTFSACLPWWVDNIKRIYTVIQTA